MKNLGSNDVIEKMMESHEKLKKIVPRREVNSNGIEKNHRSDGYA